MPEAKLAREAELCYATVAMVTDYDCWHPDHDHVKVTDIIRVIPATRSMPGGWSRRWCRSWRSVPVPARRLRPRARHRDHHGARGPRPRAVRRLERCSDACSPLSREPEVSSMSDQAADPHHSRLPQARDPVSRHHDPARTRAGLPPAPWTASSSPSAAARSTRWPASRRAASSSAPPWRIELVVGLRPGPQARQAARRDHRRGLRARVRHRPGRDPRRAFEPGERVLLIDDLIATGGTAEAAVHLIERRGGTIVGCAFVIDLPDLGGRAARGSGAPARCALCVRGRLGEAVWR